MRKEERVEGGWINPHLFIGRRKPLVLAYQVVGLPLGVVPVVVLDPEVPEPVDEPPVTV